MEIPMITIDNEEGTGIYKLPLYLYDIVMENSKDDTSWWTAVKEWSIDGYKCDMAKISSCVCSKTGLKILFRIKNDINGNIIFPIGSTCIKRFKRTDLNNNVEVYEKFCALLNSFEENNDEDEVTVDTEHFSRRSIDFYQSKGVIDSYEWRFLKGIFNRKYDTLSMREKSMKNDILRNKIIPYIKRYMLINNETNIIINIGKGNISINAHDNILTIYKLYEDHLDDKKIGDFVHPRDDSYSDMINIKVTFNEAVEMMDKLTDPNFNGTIKFKNIKFDFSNDYNNNGREELWRCFRTIALNLGGSIII